MTNLAINYLLHFLFSFRFEKDCIISMPVKLVNRLCMSKYQHTAQALFVKMVYLFKKKPHINLAALASGVGNISRSRAQQAEHSPGGGRGGGRLDSAAPLIPERSSRD